MDLPKDSQYIRCNKIPFKGTQTIKYSKSPQLELRATNWLISTRCKMGQGLKIWHLWVAIRSTPNIGPVMKSSPIIQIRSGPLLPANSPWIRTACCQKITLLLKKSWRILSRLIGNCKANTAGILKCTNQRIRGPYREKIREEEE